MKVVVELCAMSTVRKSAYRILSYLQDDSLHFDVLVVMYC